MKRIIPVLFIVINVTSCAFFQERLAVKNCKFEFNSIRPHSFSLTDLKMDINLGITNPNQIDVTVDKLDLYLYLNDEKTVQVQFNEVRIKVNERKNVTTRVTVPFSSVGISIINIIRSKGSINYKLAGKVYLKTSLGILPFPVTLYKNK